LAVINIPEDLDVRPFAARSIVECLIETLTVDLIILSKIQEKRIFGSASGFFHTDVRPGGY
jgi:hypothetical protein